jgi:hypothetical protein
MSWKDCPEPVPLVLADAPEQIDAQNTRLDKYAAVTGQERGDSGCVTKTPGGVIANKINWADTSTIRELELANDFNAIINALLNQVILMGMGSLSDAGLLGGKKPSQDNTFNEYMAYLGTLDTQLAANEAQLAANQGSSNGTGSYKPDGSINFSQNFANRAVALETINNQLAIENQYLGTQNTIFNLIDATQNAFASSTCSDTIKTEVTNQITGDYTGVKDLTWNKTDIARVSPITVNNITSLTSVLTAVQNNTNDAAVPGLVAPLTTMNTLHSAAIVSSYASGGTLYNQIRNWLVGKVTSNTCVGITPASLGL